MLQSSITIVHSDYSNLSLKSKVFKSILIQLIFIGHSSHFHNLYPFELGLERRKKIIWYVIVEIRKKTIVKLIDMAKLYKAKTYFRLLNLCQSFSFRILFFPKFINKVSNEI